MRDKKEIEQMRDIFRKDLRHAQGGQYQYRLLQIEMLEWALGEREAIRSYQKKEGEE